MARDVDVALLDRHTHHTRTHASRARVHMVLSLLNQKHISRLSRTRAHTDRYVPSIRRCVARQYECCRFRRWSVLARLCGGVNFKHGWWMSSVPSSVTTMEVCALLSDHWVLSCQCDIMLSDMIHFRFVFFFIGEKWLTSHVELNVLLANTQNTVIRTFWLCTCVWVCLEEKQNCLGHTRRWDYPVNKHCKCVPHRTCS